MEVYRVEKHIITPTHSYYAECKRVCMLSANLYNEVVRLHRSRYHTQQSFLGWMDMVKQMRPTSVYKALPNRAANNIIKQVDSSYKSFFALLKKKKKNDYDKPVRSPKLRHNRQPNAIAYTYEALNKKSFKKGGYYTISQTKIGVHTHVPLKDIVEVRVVPKHINYVVEVVYRKQVEFSMPKQHTKVAAIDLGISNLATLTFSDGSQPTIYDGKKLKSINQFYNKSIAQVRSLLPLTTLPNGKKVQLKSKKLKRMNDKRNNRIDTYIHTLSKRIVEQLVASQTTCLCVGYNPMWQQGSRLGVANNQHFVNIPFAKLIHCIKYKCEERGILVSLTEESYTSKCSFLDNETVGKHEVYKGKRTKRGVFRSECGNINADVNGSYNIMCKGLTALLGTQVNRTFLEENYGLGTASVSPRREKII